MQTRASIWLSMLLASCACASALDPSLDVSQYAHTAWKNPGGLLSRQISSIAQTPDGYLWLGTVFGLLRFDGVQAVPWSPPAGEELASEVITDLMVARDGTLWIATWKGLASWKSGKLTQYPEVAGQIVRRAVQDRDGTVWVGVYGPGKLCAIRDGKMQCYGVGSFGNSVSALYQDHNGNLWVSAQSGVWRWSPGPTEHYTFSGGPVEASALIEGDHGELLMAMAIPSAAPGTTTGAIEGLTQLVDGAIRSYALPKFAQQFRPKCLFRSSDGSLWVGTVQGLLHFHQGRIDRFSVVDGLSGDVVNNVFEDREGNIWVGTDDGLDQFHDLAVATISVKQGLSSSSVHLVQATSDGSIWIGTADGLDRWQNGHVTVYGRRNALGRVSPIDDRETSISSTVNEIANSGLPGTPQSLGQDDRGRLLASTREGIFYFEGGRFTRTPGIPGGDIFTIVGDGRGNLWMSDTQEGLLYSPAQGGAIQRMPWDRFEHRSAAVALLPDREGGGLWLGFYDGGITYLKDRQIRASYNASDGLGPGAVTNLQLGSGGAVWVATEGGLSRVKDGRITTLTSRNGLPCDTVYRAVEDNDRAFWLSTGCGLVRITRSELNAWVSDSKRVVQTTVFDSYDGAKSRRGRYGPKVTKSLDGRLWFVSFDGVSVIDPRHIPFNNLPPPVYIQQITANDKKYDPSPGLRLPPRVRDLAIDYTALSLVTPEKVHFRFKLDGQDKDWREIVNVRHVEYSNLPPGNYRFRVIACNNSGVWNEQGATSDFAIAPAYYQTIWFRALSVFTLLAVLWTVYQLRVRALKLRQVVLERHQAEIRTMNEQLITAQEAERMRIAGELHDGVLQQMTSLAVGLGTVKYQLPPDSETRAMVDGMEQRLVQIGTDIRHLSHELHPALLKDAGLPAALCAYCEEFTQVRGLPVTCEIGGSLEKLSPGAALCLYRIAQEALGNAAKYSEANKVEVRLTGSDGRVWLSVSDDGVGCTADQVGKSKGLGLINMRERVLQLNGMFKFDSEPGHGTTVTVAIPFRTGS